MGDAKVDAGEGTMLKNANHCAIVESLSAAVWCGGSTWAVIVLVPSLRAAVARPGGLNGADLSGLTIAAVWLMIAAYLSWRVLAVTDRIASQHPVVRGAIAGAAIPTSAFLVLTPVIVIASIASSWAAPAAPLDWAIAAASAAVSGVRGMNRLLDLAIWLPVTVASGIVFAVGWGRWARRSPGNLLGASVLEQ
jgi:hypothetical protein